MSASSRNSRLKRYSARGSILRQRLERDLHVALAVERLVDDAHAAGADLRWMWKRPASPSVDAGLGMRARGSTRTRGAPPAGLAAAAEISETDRR